MGHITRNTEINQLPTRWMAIVFLLLIASLSTAMPAAAQIGSTQDRIEAELNKTDLVINRARDIVIETVARSSRSHLDKAIQMQQKARNRFRNNRYDEALTLTTSARREAMKAIDTARIENRAQANVQATIERVDEKRNEIRALVKESGNPTANRIFTQGAEQLRRAWQAHKDKKYTEASTLATLAENLIDRAARLAKGQKSDISAVENAIERTDVLLTQIESALLDNGPNPELSKKLREAQRGLGNARNLVAEGNHRQAMNICLQIKKQGLRLLSQVGTGRGKEFLEDAIEDMSTLYLDVLPEIQASGNDRALQMAAEGHKLLRKSRTLLGENRLRKSLQHLLAAERLIKEAAEKAGVI
jgi:hypothetical protein